MRTQFNIDGKIYNADLRVREHAKDREVERNNRCDFSIIGQTIGLGLSLIKKQADKNSQLSVPHALMLVNKAMGHTVCLMCQWENKVLSVTVRTVIDEAENLYVTRKKVTDVEYVA